MIDELGYQVVPLESGVRRMASRELDRPSVVITFDDGFADFATLAAPLLKKHGMAATVYLTTYYAEKQLPLFNLMCPYLLWRGRYNLGRLGAEFGLKGQSATSRAGGQGLAAAQSAVLQWRKTKPAGVEEDTRFAGELADRLGIDWQELLSRRVLQLMSRQEVESLAAEGIDFQLHTHRHRTPDDPAAYRREIDDNRRVLEAWTGKPANHYCYPSGVWSPKVHPWLREAGIETATTCVAGAAAPHSNPLAVPRYLISAGLRENHFAALLSGAVGMVQPAG